MMNPILKLILSTLAIVLVTGCAATPTRLESRNQGPLPETALVIGFKLDIKEVFAKDYGCLLDIRNVDSGERYQLTVFLGAKEVVVPAPVGQYQMEKLDCQKRSYWEFTNIKMPNMGVVAGKINYAGLFNIAEHDDGNRRVFVGFVGGADLQSSFAKSAAADAPAGRLVNSWTGAPISSALVKWVKEQARLGSSSPHPWKSQIHGASDRVLANMKTPDVSPCAEEEIYRNNVRFGKWSAHATYAEGKIRKTELGDENNTFTPTFKACVQQKMQNQAPGIPDSVGLDYVFTL